MAKKVPAFLRAEIRDNAADLTQETWNGMLGRFAQCALSLLKASSIGLSSGECFGR